MPMPIARIALVAATKPGERARLRSATRKSANSLSMEPRSTCWGSWTPGKWTLHGAQTPTPKALSSPSDLQQVSKVELIEIDSRLHVIESHERSPVARDHRIDPRMAI